MSNQVTSLRMNDDRYIKSRERFRQIAEDEKIGDRLRKLLEQRAELMRRLNQNAERILKLKKTV